MSPASTNMLMAVLPPASSDKRKAWMLKTLVRRGAVYLKLNKFDQALSDYMEASAIDPNNDELLSDTKKIQESIAQQISWYLLYLFKTVFIYSYNLIIFHYVKK